MAKVDWDDYFMSMVYLIAAKSKDRRSHIGAVIVGPDKEIKSTGYNSFVRRLRDDVPERQEKPEKYFWFEHAERNAVFNATLIGTSLKGCKMYTNGIPCMDCARAVVQSGITEVIVDKSWEEKNQGDDLEHSKRSLQMFEEVGVKIRYWEGKLLNLEKFRRGEVVENSEISLASEESFVDKAERLKVKVKKIHSLAKIPSHVDKSIYVISKEIKGNYIEYGTGLIFDIPENQKLLFSPITNNFEKKAFYSNNKEELKLRFEISSNTVYKIGEKIGEIIIPDDVDLELI